MFIEFGAAPRYRIVYSARYPRKVTQKYPHFFRLRLDSHTTTTTTQHTHTHTHSHHPQPHQAKHRCRGRGRFVFAHNGGVTPVNCFCFLFLFFETLQWSPISSSRQLVNYRYSAFAHAPIAKIGLVWRPHVKCQMRPVCQLQLPQLPKRNKPVD
jgi:hypothetical protein